LRYNAVGAGFLHGLQERKTMELKTWGAIGAFVATSLAFGLVGYSVRPMEDWSSQHVDESEDPGEFYNSFLGLTVRAPKHGNWVIQSDPEEFRFKLTPGLNKILEMELMNDPKAKASERQPWARVDVFVQPVHGGIDVESVLTKLEFRKAVIPGVGLRTIRPGFRTGEQGNASVGGRRGEFRVGTWTREGKKHDVINYYTRAHERLYCFVCVYQPGSFKVHRPTFDSIVHLAEVD